MCGFLGVIKYKNIFEEGKIRQRIDYAKRYLNHRGPDQNDFFLNERIALIHTRLSIIDTSLQARQPYFDSNHEYALVFNGEIYNYKNLYEEHLKNIPGVNSHSDTSVLLYLYLKYGKDCLDLLNGMFAFGIIHVRTGDCFLARDRFGEKPLYYRLDNETLEFSSELKTIIKNSGRNYEIDLESLACFNILGIIPQPKTIIKNLFALEPGSWMEIKNGGEVKQGVYWSLDKIFHKTPETVNWDQKKVIEKTKFLFEQAVKSRLVSDVPLGIFLSAGFDSNAILSVITFLDKHDIYPITLDFDENIFAEAKDAERAAIYFKTIFYSENLKADYFHKNLPTYFNVMDQPQIDGYNTFFVSDIAQRFGRKVWLSGTGGDELFGGYRSFQRFKFLKILSRVGSFLKAGLLINGSFNVKHGRVKQMFSSGDGYSRAYQFSRNLLPFNYSNSLLPSGQLKLETENLDRIFPYTNFLNDDFQAASYLESKFYLMNQLLPSIDNFSMAHSIEVRTPFLEHNLFEFVFNLTKEQKVYNKYLKSLLADAVPIPLPDVTLYGPKKGFDFPLDKWMKDEFEETFRETVLDSSNSKYWNLSVVEELWKQHRENKISWRLLWTFYVFTKWLETIND
ncbi:MAG: asparagine synthase (glutamine-hydrolyzing) [Ignavibacteriales bacterium]|nr:MAG: asparagine synthase (glutamine-hydrolyzing) [Ignavibacteriales bacterium]